MSVQAEARVRAPSPWRLLDYWLITFRRTWRSAVIAALVVPVLYVVAMGVVLGDLVDAGSPRLDGAESYLAFVGPGLLASHVMLVVFGEVTWPVRGMVEWTRSYVAMLATPLRARDVVVAHLGAVAAKVTLVAVVFTLVLRVCGVVDGWGAAAALVPAQVLLALAFAGPVHALTVTTLSDAVLTLMWRLVATPLFLFSGAFFPISNLPGALEAVAWATPLWHGVDLSRQIAGGDVDPTSAAVHVAYLSAWAAVGAVLAVRALERRLLR